VSGVARREEYKDEVGARGSVSMKGKEKRGNTCGILCVVRSPFYTKIYLFGLLFILNSRR